jgi:hypothetical protein
VDAGDLDSVVVCANQYRRAGRAMHALACVQEQTPRLDRLAQLAVSISGHGVPAIAAIACDLGAGAAWRRLAAEPKRYDLVRQALDQGQHHPVAADGLAILERIVARPDLITGDARMREISPAAIAREKMQRSGRQKPPAASIVNAMRRSHDPVVRHDDTSAGTASTVEKGADRRPGMTRCVHVLAMDCEMIFIAVGLRRVLRVGSCRRHHRYAKRSQHRETAKQRDSHSLFPRARFFVGMTLRFCRLWRGGISVRLRNRLSLRLGKSIGVE